MKKTGLYGYNYYFLVDNDSTEVDYILNIQKKLMNKLDIKQCLE